MGVFDFLKKNDADVPPDVGKEIATPATNDSGVGDAYDPGELEPTPEEDNSEEVVTKKKKGKNSKQMSAVPNNKEIVVAGLKIERLEAQIESINALLKGFNERFSVSNQQIGEIRGIALSNEKTISKLEASSAKAIDIVSAVKPEKIRFDYEKASQRIEEVSAKVESNKEYLNTLVEEMKDLKRKAESFIGADGLLSLQKDIKKDLMNIQQINAKVQMHADKTEQMFIESQKRANEYTQFIEKLNNFEGNYSFMKKDLEKIRIDFTNIATKNELNDIKKRVESKIALIDGSIGYIEKVKDDGDRVLRLVEDSVSLSKKNEQEIHDVALTLGDDKISKVGDYDERLNSLLTVIDALAGQISQIKKKVGLDSDKIKVTTQENKSTKSGLSNIELSPKMSEKLISPKKKEEVIAPEIVSPVIPLIPEVENKQDIIAPEISSLEKPEISNVELDSPTVDSEIKEKEEIKEMPKPKAPRKKRVKKIVKQEIPLIPDLNESEHFSEVESKSLEQDNPLNDEIKSQKVESYEDNLLRRKSNFLERLKNQYISPIPQKEEKEEELPSFDVAEKEVEEHSVSVQLNKLIAESMSLADSALKSDLENRYVHMKQLFALLPSHDKMIYQNILKFYDKIYARFYTESFY